MSGWVGYLLRKLVLVAVFAVCCVAASSVLTLIGHLLFGDEISLRSALVGGIRLFGVELTSLMIVYFIVPWLRWFADRRTQKG